MKTKLLFLLFGLSFVLCVSVFGQGHGDIFPISTANGYQDYSQIAYNANADEYLVVWEDSRNSDSTGTDIYGQIVNGNGTVKDSNIVICNAMGEQYWPRLDFDPFNNRYLVVFQDHRKGWNLGDIRGAFVNADGTLENLPTSANDGSFAICSHEADIYTCSVAFNYTDMKYLVVWGDNRGDPNTWAADDVYGQIIDADGTLLSPPAQADSMVNFPIANNPDIVENVADVTYNSVTNEWFVVYGTDLYNITSTYTGYVVGQRVDSNGNLLDRNGLTLAKNTSISNINWGTAIVLSLLHYNGPDCFHAKVQANNEYGQALVKASGEIWSECEVVWKGRYGNSDEDDNDIYGQRIAFFNELGKFVAKFVDLDGNIKGDTLCNQTISIQDYWPEPPEVAYSTYDNEFLVSWPNETSNNWGDPEDLWGQRLAVDSDNNQEMIFLADDRVNTVTNTENILYAGTENHEGGAIMGVAHSSTRNEFLISFTYRDTSFDSGFDIYGLIVKGSEPTGIDFKTITNTDQFELQQNYPNPFNPETTIRYYLKEAVNVNIAVYDLTGRKIKTLVNGLQSNGSHRIVWNGINDNGINVSSGIYLYKMNYNGKSLSKKMSLIR